MNAAPDGSPVEVYARLPELGEGEIVASVLPAGASVLELGCGPAGSRGSSCGSAIA
jgi:hypothetical protein